MWLRRYARCARDARRQGARAHAERQRAAGEGGTAHGQARRRQTVTGNGWLTFRGHERPSGAAEAYRTAIRLL